MLVPAALAGQAEPRALLPPDTSPVAIMGVTVVDVTRGLLVPDQTVVIRGTYIAAVGSTGSTALPSNARVVNGRGKFLIPGLWDMHVHASRQGRPPYFWPLFLAHGVTGIREMGSYRDTLLYWRAVLKRKPAAGPRAVWSSPILDGVPPFSGRAVALATPDQARAVVDTMKALGFDFLKVYGGLTRPVYDALADEARRQAIPFAGHTGPDYPPSYAAAKGQHSIEHLSNVVEECTPGLLEATARLASSRNSGAPPESLRVLATRVNDLRRIGYDAARCDTLLHTFLLHHTYQDPTLVALRGQAGLGPVTPERDPRRRWVAADLWALWIADRAQDDAGASDEVRAGRRALFASQQRLVGAMARANVGLLAGTDLPDPFLYAGESLHEELALLVEAGLTPLAALQAATLNPARFLNATDSLGTVAPGKLADLVLLDANPIADIHNTQKIHAVIANGRYFGRAALRALLAEAERAAKDAAPPGVPSRKE